MFRLAHLSDPHLGPLPKPQLRELAGKRVLGYLNWRLNRGRGAMRPAVLDALVDDIRAHVPDHTCVTGDIVNLALDDELAPALDWLQSIGTPQDVSVVPGNHDAYVPGAFAKVCREWAPWMSGDEISGDHHAGPRDHRDFPYLRIRGDIALIGVSSARATAPFMANGYLREGQGRRLAALLDETAARGLCRVVMIHHPPVRNAVPQHKRLFGIGRFGRIMKRHGAELVLHGHSHDPSLNFLDGADGPVPVVGVAAAGQAPGGKHAPAQYNLIDIAADGTGWNLKLTRRGLEGATLPPADLEVRDLVARSGEKVISVKSAERSA